MFSSEIKSSTLLHFNFQLKHKKSTKMASSLVYKTLKWIRIPNPIRVLTTSSRTHHLSSTAAVHQQTQSDDPSSSFTFSPSSSNENDESIFIKGPKEETTSLSSVTMPMSFMTGSIVGRRFYKQVTTREADDRNGWTVMLDYRTLKTPSKRALKLPTLGLAKAIDAEWDYQVCLCAPFTFFLLFFDLGISWV